MATQISTRLLSTRLLRTGLGLSLAVLVSVACQSTTGTGDSRGDFGTEATPTDPGLGDRGGMQGGTSSSRAVDGGLRTIYFDFDDHSLRPEARDTLRHNAAVLAQNGNARLEIQGNCDERGTDEYNLALGKRRAEAAKRYLVDLGVSPNRVTTISFGEENPAVRGHTEAAWSKNRRDDFVLR